MLLYFFPVDVREKVNFHKTKMKKKKLRGFSYKYIKNSKFWCISLEYFVGWAQTSHFWRVSSLVLGHISIAIFFYHFFKKSCFFTIFRIPQIQRPPSSTKSFWNHARIPMGWCGPVHWFWKEIVSITKQKKSLCPRSPYVEYWRYVKYIKRSDLDQTTT